MASNSTKSVYHGTTPHKPIHRFSVQQPTPHPVDDKSLREYRLESYKKGPDSVPLLRYQVSSLNSAQVPHETRVAAELETILSRLG
ncbi:hypothetical protein F4805DRAFT_460041 [Annulohypoxylon moriforme]|nr:hypothetical protein F4805DRAFT_460041 [Annulohypoxylon moriforme]